MEEESQPPCEAVSWNAFSTGCQHNGKHQSASLWGCELKFNSRILLNSSLESASLWGCELKYYHQFPMEYWQHVSLLVRLWVEITLENALFMRIVRQPPCEAVSWNAVVVFSVTISAVSLLVRLWVEIVYQWFLLQYCVRQPPCEAVSWNASAFNSLLVIAGQPPCEAVSWNAFLRW